MDAIRIFLDGGIFSTEVVARTAHRYTGTFFVQVTSEPSGISASLTPKDETTDVRNLWERFHNDALDERLRERVRDETRELHNALVQVALREAKPAPGSPE
ncbi:hypothetical protein AB4Y64_02785 [Lysobacter sp. TAF61]|uniref:hypothetical protein n=1 Tax=Lysobacter sp. TAF61 TaxID=3233072 RepID=UPI003F9C9C15